MNTLEGLVNSGAFTASQFTTVQVATQVPQLSLNDRQAASQQQQVFNRPAPLRVPQASDIAEHQRMFAAAVTTPVAYDQPQLQGRGVYQYQAIASYAQREQWQHMIGIRVYA